MDLNLVKPDCLYPLMGIIELTLPNSQEKEKEKEKEGAKEKEEIG